MSDKVIRSAKILYAGITTERIREIIDKSGLTREAIASGIGMDASTVTKYYNGDRNLTVDAVVRFSKFFNVSADYILGLSRFEIIDETFKLISECTGLNVKSVKELNNNMAHKDLLNDNNYFNYLNEIIVSLIYDVYEYVDAYNKLLSKVIAESNEYEMYLNDWIQHPEIENGKNEFWHKWRNIKKQYELSQFKIFQTQKAFENVINNILGDKQKEANKKMQDLEKKFDNAYIEFLQLECGSIGKVTKQRDGSFLITRADESESDELNGNDN